MNYKRYIGKRLLLLILQVVGIVTISFFLLRMLPGDPVTARLGMLATEEAKAMLRQEMGLDQPMLVQFKSYVSGVVRGDLGQSWRTGNPVLQDLIERFPVTFELITYSMFLALFIGSVVGIFVSVKPIGFLEKVTRGYSFLAGALPDFYVGLLFIFFFYFILGWAPSPTGRISFLITPPQHITGSYIIDGILQGNWAAASSAATRLILPVLSLTFVWCAPFMKMARSTMMEIMDGDFIHYAKVSGLDQKTIRKYSFRNSYPPLLNLFAMSYTFVLGGAVLIEKVFSLPGMGLYSVLAIENSDYAALSGFILVASMFFLMVYLILDLVVAAIDPRARL